MKDQTDTYTSISQSSNDVAKSRQTPVYVLSFIKQSSLCTCFTDLQQNNLTLFITSKKTDFQL